MISTRQTDLWSLVLDHQYVAPEDLVRAIEDQIIRGDLDFRTRLLIRDGVNALERYWGREHVQDWLTRCPVRSQIQSIRGEDLGRLGFPFLGSQLVEPTSPETVKQLLRELGQNVHQRVRIYIGGSIAMIVPGYLVRRTQDLDVIDEVPEEIRNQHQLLERILQRYRLEIATSPSHYLPSGWMNRVHYLDDYGPLQVYLVDVYDVFLSKLFSRREKDRDDLREALPRLDKETLILHLKDTAQPLLADDKMRPAAENNWYILFGEPLPA